MNRIQTIAIIIAITVAFNFLSLSAVGQTLTTPLPVVAATHFEVGNEWIWDYFDAEGKAYSSERYRVISRSGTIVVFEMASTYNSDPIPQIPHHRLRVDIAKCLNAYKNSYDPKPWSLELFYWDTNANNWISTGVSHPLAFEEKFNCNPHPHETRWQWTVELDQKQGASAFHHRKKTASETSWFNLDGTNAAVAVEKEFHQRGQLTYHFVRRRVPFPR